MEALRLYTIHSRKIAVMVERAVANLLQFEKEPV
jgi:hypothetical protein